VTEHLGIARMVAMAVAKHGWLPYDDAMQEACLGMMSAAKRYDPNIAKWATYAYFCAMRACSRATMQQTGVIRTPVWAWTRRSPFHQFYLDLWQSPSQARGDVVPRTLESRIASGATATDDEVAARHLSVDVLERIKALPLRLQRVVIGRFYEDKTLEEIGQEFGTSRERIRQLQVVALGILKESMEDLRDAL